MNETIKYSDLSLSLKIPVIVSWTIGMIFLLGLFLSVIRYFVEVV